MRMITVLSRRITITPNLRVEQINDLRRSDSFDGSLFGLNDVLQALNNTRQNVEALIYSEIDEEIQRYEICYQEMTK